MSTENSKHDLRDGLPGHEGSLAVDPGARRVEDVPLADDSPVATEPEIVTPEVGRNVPSGQATKG